MSADSLSWLSGELSHLDERHLRRHLRTRQSPQGPRIEVDGQSYINFAANDYLNLASDPRLQQAALAAAQRLGWGAGASPLIVGHSSAHVELEQHLARWLQTEAALVFSSGVAANIGTISALVHRGDAVYSDALNHASIIDGCRLSRATIHIYHHGDVQHLRKLLSDTASHARRRLLVTDSLFSMHGDVAPLPELVELAEEFDCMLMVDEAHATGVWGVRGTGLVEEFGLEAQIPIRLGTLSKGLGCCGGFVAGRQELIDWLINRARSYIFSTAPPAPSTAAAVAAIEIAQQESQRRGQLRELATHLAAELQKQGWQVGTGRPGPVTQILPIVIGDAQGVLEAAAWLREQGVWVPAIRPPSVSPGESCLRISLMAGHTPEMIAQLLTATDRLRKHLASLTSTESNS